MNRLLHVNSKAKLKQKTLTLTLTLTLTARRLNSVSFASLTKIEFSREVLKESTSY